MRFLSKLLKPAVEKAIESVNILDIAKKKIDAEKLTEMAPDLVERFSGYEALALSIEDKWDNLSSGYEEAMSIEAANDRAARVTALDFAIKCHTGNGEQRMLLDMPKSFMSFSLRAILK